MTDIHYIRSYKWKVEQYSVWAESAIMPYLRNFLPPRQSSKKLKNFRVLVLSPWPWTWDLRTPKTQTRESPDPLDSSLHFWISKCSRGGILTLSFLERKHFFLPLLHWFPPSIPFVGKLRQKSFYQCQGKYLWGTKQIQLFFIWKYTWQLPNNLHFYQSSYFPIVPADWG